MASAHTSKRERSALRRRLRRGFEPRPALRIPGLDGRCPIGDTVDPADGVPGGPGRGGPGHGGAGRGGPGQAGLGDGGSSRERQGDADLGREEEAERLFEIMLSLAGAGNAIDLRIARLAAWVKTRDPAKCGYSSHTALFRQHIAWSNSWLRSLVRLVESDLPAIQAAVCLGLIPLSTAIKAPGHVDPEEQAWWLERAQRGDKGLASNPRGRSQDTSPRTVRTVDLEGEDLRAIHGARQLSRLVSGHPLSNADSDYYVLDCWAKRVDGKQLLSHARRSPPPPPKRTTPEWCGGCQRADQRQGAAGAAVQLPAQGSGGGCRVELAVRPAASRREGQVVSIRQGIAFFQHRRAPNRNTMTQRWCGWRHPDRRSASGKPP